MEESSKQAREQGVRNKNPLQSAKALQKKNSIRETAFHVFAKKGFKDVTMKDIAEACGISRGGLYLYYESTEELFLDLLQYSSEKTGDEFEKTIAGMNDAGEILRLFLIAQKKELFEKDKALTKASYEYAFAYAGDRDERHPGMTELRKTFEDAVRVIEFLIRMGKRQHRFFCEDNHAAAVNIMLVVEGLKICSETIGLEENQVDREIDFILESLTRRSYKERA